MLDCFLDGLRHDPKSKSLDFDSQEVWYPLSKDFAKLPGMANKEQPSKIPRMGERIRLRLIELEMKQVDVLNRLPDLDKGTLSAMIRENRIASEWSDEIAEVLEVEHRWLQKGTEPKMRIQWPFKHVSKQEVAELPPETLARIEGFIEARLEEHRESGRKSTG